jgi:hypothetical protein
MCTVSIVPVDGGYRLACNRDELKTRPMARPPVRVGSCGRTVIYPIDPISGGTWVGVNDAGLAIALLNLSAPPHEVPPRRSRGTIIPPLLELASVERAIETACHLDARAFQPFRLVLVQDDRVGVISCDEARLSIARQALLSPCLFTSSSLGDAMVETPRRQLFEQMMNGASAVERTEAQDRFHSHRWPDRPHLSVWMSRHDASTVSRSVVNVIGDEIGFEYVPLHEAG